MLEFSLFILEFQKKHTKYSNLKNIYDLIKVMQADKMCIFNPSIPVFSNLFSELSAENTHDFLMTQNIVRHF